MRCKYNKCGYIKGYRVYGERGTKVAAMGARFLHVTRPCLIMCLCIVVILLI